MFHIAFFWWKGKFLATCVYHLVHTSCNRPRSSISNLTWLRDFRDKRLHLVLFSSCPSVLWKLRDKRTLQCCNFDLKASEPCKNIETSNVAYSVWSATLTTTTTTIDHQPPTTAPAASPPLPPLQTSPIPSTITTTRQGITVYHEQRRISFIYILMTSCSLLKLHCPQPSAEERIHPNQLCKEVTPCQASESSLKWHGEKKMDWSLGRKGKRGRELSNHISFTPR